MHIYIYEKIHVKKKRNHDSGKSISLIVRNTYANDNISNKLFPLFSLEIIFPLIVATDNGCTSLI